MMTILYLILWIGNKIWLCFKAVSIREAETDDMGWQVYKRIEGDVGRNEEDEMAWNRKRMCFKKSGHIWVGIGYKAIFGKIW